MATQNMRVAYPRKDKMKPLPSPPSPTLTNPDMVLPNEPTIQFPISPPRSTRMNRPPSPSYLRDKTSESSHSRSGSSGSTVMMASSKPEKRGLMSRKMLLLRSRTASGDVASQLNGQRTPPSRSRQQHRFEEFEFAYGSSPTVMDEHRLAPEQPEQRRESNGGASDSSEDMSGLPQFLAKYEANNTSGTDDELESSPAPQTNYSVSIYDDGLEAQRRQQEQDEQTSALLSQRAEQILANAKKRLNLMEGNLRGARDLVTPLTAANLKRATSVGGAANFGGRSRYVYDAHYDSPAQQPYRTLHAQASSPTMGRDFQGHWRGFSETELPERPYTALDTTSVPMMAQNRISEHASNQQRNNALKGSRSYDSLGPSAFRQPASRTKGSPDPNLDPVAEDEGYYYQRRPSGSIRSSSSRTDSHDGLGINRSPSRSEDLREQMSSLRGRISNLKERAREDSLRRQSMQNLREPSPLNNATDNAPEFFYTSSPAYGTPALDTKAGVGTRSQENSPATPQSAQKVWEPTQVVTGSRNAFAEQAQRLQQQGHASDGNSGQKSPQKQQPPAKEQNVQPRVEHKRTASGTAIVQSSKHRYSHHQYNQVANDSGGNTTREAIQVNGVGEIGTAHDGSSQYGDDQSDAGASHYEDAESEAQPQVVAHEDREDAFDYEHFFLHSAMGGYNHTARRDSSSSTETASSVSTARGPTAAGLVDADDDDGDDELDDDEYGPGTPETPEKLREIERNLHKRTYSDDSVSSLATFATATEGFDSPPASKRSSVMNWPIAPVENFSRPSSTPNSRPNSRPGSRPGTAVARPATAIPVKAPGTFSDASSDRADSGVALNGSNESKRQPPRPIVHRPSTSGSGATPSSTLSPPMSPRTMLMQDPATVAVNSLLAPNGRPLGLKDKALLFGLVDSLRKVAHRLQEGDETDYESRTLRRKVDDARRILDGEVKT